MILKDGKFWDGDVQVPIEHGNKEQIKILERAQSLRGVGVWVKGIDNTNEVGEGCVMFSFNCLCGFEMYKVVDVQVEVSIENKTCNGCGLEYRISGCEHPFFIKLNLVK